MSPLSRILLTVSVVLVVAACDPSQSPSRAASASTSPAHPSAGPSPTSDASTSVGQTDTGWGRIWDGVPAGFPRYPGSAPAEDASGAPSSLRYAVSGSSPETIAAWLQAGMGTVRFSTDVSGPLEDGSFALGSVGDAGCRIQTTIAPLGGLTFVTVLYGADCQIR